MSKKEPPKPKPPPPTWGELAKDLASAKPGEDFSQRDEILLARDRWDTLGDALFAAIACVQRVDKASFNQHHQYPYASAEDILQESRRVLLANGLMARRLTWRVIDRDDSGEYPAATVEMDCVIAHPKSGEHLEAMITFPAISGKGRPIDKAIAAALTEGWAYWLRDQLQIPRVDQDVSGRDDSQYQRTGPYRASEPRQESRTAPISLGPVDGRYFGLKKAGKAAAAEDLKPHPNAQPSKGKDGSWFWVLPADTPPDEITLALDRVAYGPVVDDAIDAAMDASPKLEQVPAASIWSTIKAKVAKAHEGEVTSAGITEAIRQMGANGQPKPPKTGQSIPLDDSKPQRTDNTSPQVGPTSDNGDDVALYAPRPEGDPHPRRRKHKPEPDGRGNDRLGQLTLIAGQALGGRPSEARAVVERWLLDHQWTHETLDDRHLGPPVLLEARHAVWREYTSGIPGGIEGLAERAAAPSAGGEPAAGDR